MELGLQINTQYGAGAVLSTRVILSEVFEAKDLTTRPKGLWRCRRLEALRISKLFGGPDKASLAFERLTHGPRRRSATSLPSALSPTASCIVRFAGLRAANRGRAVPSSTWERARARDERDSVPDCGSPLPLLQPDAFSRFSRISLLRCSSPETRASHPVRKRQGTAALQDAAANAEFLPVSNP